MNLAEKNFSNEKIYIENKKSKINFVFKKSITLFVTQN